MEKIACPYCEVEVSMEDIDNEGGTCPECGAIITGSLLFNGSNNDYEDEEELDDKNWRE
jgi:transcription initiation factor TFIIIB Brf1 subunit/transcription initiation factor TFIIB